MILIKNSIIITQDKKRRIIKGGAIFIEGEKIKEVGRSESVVKKYGRYAKKIIDGKNKKAVLPGLINSHTHSAMTLLRGYADDLPLKSWLEEKIWPAEAKMTGKDIYRGSDIAIMEMLDSGTTCFNDMYWEPEQTAKAGRKRGIRSFLGVVLLDFQARGGKEHAVEFVKNFHDNGTVKITCAPHSIYTVCKENLIWARDFAQKHGLHLHIHASETEGEVKECLQKNGLRPIQYLHNLGLLGPKTTLAHCVWLSGAEIKLLVKTGTSVVHCPTSNLKLASGIMPFGKLASSGVNIALGTDGACSNNTLDMFSEMKIAALIHKADEMDPAVASAQEILDTATINGAKALGLEKELGSLESGKYADVIVLDLDRPHLTPLNNVISHLVYSAKGSDVETTIVNGKIVSRR